MDIMTFSGEQMRIIRIIKGISQTELADLMGCSTKAIWDWENGKVVPSPRHFKSLANALDCDPTHLTEYFTYAIVPKTWKDLWHDIKFRTMIDYLLAHEDDEPRPDIPPVFDTDNQ